MVRRPWAKSLTAVVVLASACGSGGTAREPTAPESEPQAETTISTPPEPTTTVAPTSTAENEEAVALAEEFIDAFYSWDPEALAGLPWSENAELGAISYYQGWAEAGNYEVINRQPCEAGPHKVTCDITVRDDLIGALDLDFNVTDTFHLFISDGEITAVETSSDDPPLVGEAFNWVMSQESDLMGGPCKGLFAGGPTPGECVKAVVQGFEDFRASEDFPNTP